MRHDVKCALFPDPYDEREPTGSCTCGADDESGPGEEDGPWAEGWETRRQQKAPDSLR